MQFPQTVEYALRAMAYLVLASGGQPQSAHVLAEGTGIPLAYLSKVLRKLVRAGLLDAQRGHGGGFTLTRAPERITFAEILEAVGYAADSNRCVFGMSACDPTHPCPLHPAWVVLKQRFGEWAHTTTLADLQRKGVTPPG